MRTLALILNVGAIVAVVSVLVTSTSAADLDGILLLLLFGVSAVVNLLALRAPTADGWISLFFRRKRLEEERRIREIEGRN